MTDDEKIACIDKQLEMNQGSQEFWLFRTSYGDFNCHCKLRSEKIEAKIETTGDLIEAVNEAYVQFLRLTDKIPEFNANRTIEHYPSVDEEIPF